MKIVRLIQEFPEEINRGLAPNVYYISKEQVKQGHKVWIFSFTKEIPSRITKDGIKIIRLKMPPAIRWTGGLTFFSAIKKERIEPDIVHGLQPISLGWLFPLAKINLKSKTALSLHCSIQPLKHGYVSGFKNIIQNYEFTFLSRYLSKRVDLILPVAKFIKNELKQLKINQNIIKPVPSGINYKMFNKNRPKKEEDGAFNILYVGRFAQLKGLSYLLDSFKVLNKDGGFRLTLIGGQKTDDCYESVLNTIKKLNISNDVKIINTLPQEKIIKYYHSSDLFILPSICEPRGKVILEAMASGVPVIATDSGGTSEIIKNNKNGILVSARDTRAIINETLNIKNNKILRENLIKNGIATAKIFDWSTIAEQYSIRFKNLINEK